MAKKVNFNCLQAIKYIFMSVGCWYAETPWEKRHVKIGFFYAIIVFVTYFNSIIFESITAPLTNVMVSRSKKTV